MWCRPEPPSPASVSAMEERYNSLRLSEALNRSYDYPAACEELSVILRRGYSKLPKTIQALLLRDTLTAFQRLPEVLTSHGMSSAIVLSQSADAVLPKQKRSLASAKFKQAAVAHKRHYKVHYEEGSMQLPQDVILDIFGFLDMRSLVTASSVCWAWNSAASDNMLWRLHYARLFGKYDVSGSKEQSHREVHDNNDAVPCQNTEKGDPMSVVNWREVFKRKYLGDPFWKFSSKRALCADCGSLIWISSILIDKANHCPKPDKGKNRMKPISSNMVVDYLFGMISAANSDSDSDSEDNVLRFWKCSGFSGPEDDLYCYY